MKVKQFLVEIYGYDREKKKITEERDVLLLKYPEEYPLSPKDIINLVNALFVNAEDKWDLTHDILTIEDKLYKVTSGNTDYSEERLN